MLTSSRGFSCPFAEVSGHKWAAWNHPDPKGHQYRAVLFALEEFRSRNIPCALLWVDYTSIPQSNVFLQQAAINSLSVYATYSSVFLTLVTNDSNDQEALHSYNQRGWCRLELLSFMACGWSERESYICDGSLGKKSSQVMNLHFKFSQLPMFGGSKPPPHFPTRQRHRYSLTGRTAMSEEMYLDVLGGSFSCCARISLGSLCGKHKVFHVETGKHRCFDAEILMKQDRTICKVRCFFGASPEVPT